MRFSDEYRVKRLWSKKNKDLKPIWDYIDLLALDHNRFDIYLVARCDTNEIVYYNVEIRSPRFGGNFLTGGGAKTKLSDIKKVINNHFTIEYEAYQTNKKREKNLKKILSGEDVDLV